MVRCIVCNDIVEYDTTWTRTTYTTCTKCRLPVEKSERLGMMSNKLLEWLYRHKEICQNGELLDVTSIEDCIDEIIEWNEEVIK